jgi:proteasome alpha subunit
MQFMPNQVMGYDRAITVFSPDGRLLQVEYAKKAVSLGALALGIKFKDGIMLMADRHRTDKLIIPKSVNKVFKIENHVTMTSAGFISDARVIVKKARLRAQQHKVTYGEPIDIEGIVKYLADLEQAYTQYGGIRPFGVSLLLGGVEARKDPSLFLIEPSGIYFKYKAKAVGMRSEEADKLLEKAYKENLDAKSAVKIGLAIFKKLLGKEFNLIRLETSVVTQTGTEEVASEALTKY